ncbi:hypothetical protein EDD36DRAFT_76675 [Exophiala viscosa]|uniref:Uncharacterized protein n=1 Tax=Exophiala viscosa TaxID=2486360 RepID=A0AAN6DN36_9EURO|nr:hypothetical protein EDD36DRAFT_76675 [Exophiala viscosa]
MATLPSIVLRTIAMQLVDDLKDNALCKKAVSVLCSLRLTCRELAQMGLIKTVLFSSINLYATKNNMLRVEQTDFSAIGPSIRQINFFPSPYFYNLKFSDFKKMLDLHNAQITDSNLCERCSARLVRNNFQETCDGRYPLSRDEILMRYQSYMERACEDKHSAIDGWLAKVWVKMLRFSQYVDTIKLCPASQATSQMPYPLVQVDCGECHTCCENVGLIDAMAGGSGDCLLTAVYGALASSLPIKNLSIECELMDATTANWRALRWRTAILEQVEPLIIKELPYGMRGHSDDSARDVKASVLVSDALWEVRKTVQHIILLRRSWPMAPRRSDLLPFFGYNGEFPCLRFLDLKSFYLWTSYFTSFIASCAALQTLSLEKCKIAGPDGEWKAFFDSVRERPRALHLTFYGMGSKDGPWDFNSGLGRNAGDGVSTSDSAAGLQKSLFLYLSRLAGWDTVLEDRFSETW